MKKLFFYIFLSCIFALGAHATNFKVDPIYSSVGFKIKNLQISNVTGNFNKYEGDFEFDEDKKIFTKMRASIDVASVDTDSKGRDEHLLKEDFFNVVKFPKMDFEMTSYEKISDTEGKIKGKLTLVGVSKEIELESEINGIAVLDQGHNKGQKRMGLTLEGKIKRTDFNYAPNTSTISLGDEVKITVNIEAMAI